MNNAPRKEIPGRCFIGAINYGLRKSHFVGRAHEPADQVTKMLC